MKKYIILFVTAQLIFNAGAQTLEEMQSKYFSARNRYKKWIISHGTEPGQSLPTESIYLNTAIAYPYTHEVMGSNGQDSFIPDSLWYANPSHVLNTEPIGSHGADNPLIELGDYMSVLSTEYWLMKYYGRQNTEEFTATKNEIYFLLAAIDRLDGSAESYFDQTLVSRPSHMNGFLCRDDVSDNREDRINDYYGKKAHPNGELQQLGWNSRGSITPDTMIEYFDSTFETVYVKVKDTLVIDTLWSGSTFTLDTNYYPIVKDSVTGILLGKRYNKFYKRGYRLKNEAVWRPERTDGTYGKGPGIVRNEMSIDELIGLFGGITYLQKFVDEDATAQPRPTDSSKALVQWSRDIMHRLMTHLSQTTYKVRFYDGETYEWQQILACIKDRKGLAVFRKVKREEIAAADACPECLNHNLYSKYTSRAGEGSVYNPIVLKEANYVLTNQAKNNKHVHRGPNGFPFGYPLEIIGERCASGGGITRDYPGTSVKLDNEESILLNSGLGRLAGGVLPALAGFVWWPFNEIAGDKNKTDNLAAELSTRCVGINILGVQGTSQCLVGMKFAPRYPWYWRGAWEHLGNRTKVLNKLWLKYATEAGSPNVMAAKLAAYSGTWTQDDFEHFANECGFDLMTLQYDVLNGKHPKRSKQFYKDLFANMDCQGSAGLGYPFDRDALGGGAMKPSTRNITHGNTGNYGSNVGYMLYYNLYRIAGIRNWGDDEKNYEDNSCPCHQDSFAKGYQLMTSAIEPDFKVIRKPDNTFFSYYTYENAYQQRQSLVKTKDANPNHIPFGVRNPEYLNHNYKVKGGQKLQVSRDLVVCNALLTLEAGSELLIDTSKNVDSPNEVIVRNNSVLDAKGNSVIHVSNKARLVINEGSKLIIYANTQIILNGPEAVLHIKGDVELKLNTTFEITGGPAGKGYVIWESHYQGKGQTAHLIAGSNCSAVFTQNNTGLKALETRGNAGFETPYNLVKLDIHDCTVLIGNNSRLSNHALDGVFEQVAFRGAFGASTNPTFDYKLTAQGLYQLGSKNLFKNTNFYSCKYGLTAFSNGYNYPLKLENVNFLDCEVGLRNNGHKLRWNQGEIDKAAPVGGSHAELATYTGIFGIGQQGLSYINQVGVHLLRSNPVNAPSSSTSLYGMHLHGSGRYNIYKSGFNNGDFGIYGNQQSIYSWCSRYINNKKQFALGSKATLALAGNKWNTVQHENNTSIFTKEYIPILGWEELKLYLDKGKNAFHGASANGFERNVIRAWLHPKLPLDTSASDPTKKALAAIENGWGLRPTANSGLLPFPQSSGNSNLLLQGNGQSIYRHMNDVPHYNQSYGQGWENDRDEACETIIAGPWNYSGILAGSSGVNGFNPVWASHLLHGGSLVGSGDIEMVFRQNRHPLSGTIKGIVDDFYTSALMRPLNYYNLIDKGMQLSLIQFPDEIALHNYEAYQLVQDLYTELLNDSNYSESTRLSMATGLKAGLIRWSNALMLKSKEPLGNWRHFRFELVRDRALIHRYFGERNRALNWLDEKIPVFNSPHEVRELQNWRCLIATEQEYLDSQITIDELFDYGCLRELVNPNLNPLVEWNPNDFNSVIHGQDFIEEQEGGGGMPNPEGKEGAVIELKEGLRVYPNPSKDVFFYKSTAGKAMENIQVLSVDGTLIMNLDKPPAEGRINLSHQANGLYILRFNVNQRVQRCKVLLLR